MSEEVKGPVSENYKNAPEAYLTSFGSKFAAFPVLEAKFATLYTKPPIKALQAKGLAQGFKPLAMSEGKKALFGATNTFKSSDGKTASFDLAMHAYEKPGSKDQAAVVTMTFRAGDNSETYHCMLVAPNGDFEKAQELTVGPNNAVIPTHSFWTRFLRCLSSKCGSACLGAIPTCQAADGSWTTFLWCLVTRCGSCVLRCAACAGCNCSWWCRWAAGCCEG